MKLNLKTAVFLPGLTVILSVLLGACGLPATPTPTVDVSQFYTQAAATIVLGLTQTAQALPSATLLPPPTSTPQPATATQNQAPAQTAAPVTPTPLPQPIFPSSTPILVNPATAHGCYNATFMADVNLQYAPAFKPGDHFTKTWRVKNTGTCDWPRGFLIFFVSGDRFGTDTSVIDQKVAAGEVTEISLAMTAPYLSGVISSNWQLATEIGKPFGPVLSVSITLPTTSNTTSGGCLNSALISDITISTGTELKTGESFTKTWSVKNTGTCPWTRDFKITFIGGDLFSADTTKIRQVVAPGESTEISLNMTAPGSAGIFNSAWQLASDTGQLFGQLFAFSIVVK